MLAQLQVALLLREGAEMLAMMSLICVGLLGMAFLPDPMPQSFGEDPGSSDPDVEGGDDRESLENFLFGTDSDDLLVGSDQLEYVDGFGGDDMISGGDGPDRLHGGLGDDTIDGGGGGDALFGHIGDDRINGDIGDDRLVGGDGNDLLMGGEGDDLLSGSLGDDRLVGGPGHDTLHGGEGDDILDGLSGEEHPERDYLNGGAGIDEIRAGLSDIVSGGTEADKFIVELIAGDVNSPAEITDFVPGEDEIEIQMPNGELKPDIQIVSRDGGSLVFANGLPVVFVSNIEGLSASAIMATSDFPE